MTLDQFHQVKQLLFRRNDLYLMINRLEEDKLIPGLHRLLNDDQTEIRKLVRASAMRSIQEIETAIKSHGITL